MAHATQRAFFARTRARFAIFFDGVHALDCGSLDVNGSLRELFTKSDYTGIDIRAGRNVDVVTRVHEFHSKDLYDIVVSAEMLEHDEWWDRSLRAMYSLLKSRGLLVFSCAGPGRPEHGTRAAPDTIGGPQGDGLWGTRPDYYHPLDDKEIAGAFWPLDANFHSFGIEYLGPPICDLYFWGIKA